MSYILNLKRKTEKLNKYILVSFILFFSIFILLLLRFLFLVSVSIFYIKSYDLEHKSFSVNGFLSPKITLKDFSYGKYISDYHFKINADDLVISPGININIDLINPKIYSLSSGASIATKEKDEGVNIKYNIFNKTFIIAKNELLIYLIDKNKPAGKIKSDESKFFFKQKNSGYEISVFLNSKILFNEKYGNPIHISIDSDLSYSKDPIAFDIVARKFRISEKRFTNDISGKVQFYKDSGLNIDVVMWISNVDEIFDDIVNYFMQISDIYKFRNAIDNNLSKKAVYLMYSKIVRNLINNLKQNERKIDGSTSKSLLIDIKSDADHKIKMNGIFPDNILSIILNGYKNN